MSKPIHPIALFRLMVLGPLASRSDIERGEIKSIATELAKIPYNIPDSKRTYVSKESILRWYYEYKRGGIAALQPLSRNDKGKTHLPSNIQEVIIQLKQDNPTRSIATIVNMIERQGLVSKGMLSRSTVHRFLQQHKLSKRLPSSINTIERRSFVAKHAGDLWQGDVLHGPCIPTEQGMRKSYLVSLMDDATRLIVHSAFCLGESALDIEGVLKQAILKRGLPNKLLIDNGPAYRAQSLQSICAYLDVRLIYCKPYEPQAKGKLERFHRTFREQFLDELDVNNIKNLDDLNARLWVWCESVYHTRAHTGLAGKSPIERWRQELVHVRHLSPAIIERLDNIFLHRVQRRVRRDATVSWEGQFYEVHHHQVGETITLLVDPHAHHVVNAETAFGDPLIITKLDRQANLVRKRQRPHAPFSQHQQTKYNVEIAYEDYLKSISLFSSTNDKE